MAFNKKKKRKIIVDDKEFFWSATGNDEWIDLYVSSEIKGSPKILCKFEYHHLPVTTSYVDILANQFVITPHIVRQVIEYAFSIGWKPFEKGKDLNLLHIDDKINLRLDKNIAINDKEFWFQFSLYGAGIKNKE